jgi:hypothetical protein
MNIHFGTAIADSPTMKNIILSCLAAVVLVSVVGCSCDKNCTSTNQSAPMQTDAKDMKK